MNRLRPYLEAAGIPLSGAVSFEGCLPLLECRAAARIPQEAQTVVVCGFPYYTGEYPGRNLSRYAIVPDYHRVAGELLEQACARLRADFPADFQWFVDNSPIREVDAACRAGLGVRGENGLLIHPVYGSWLFLGSIVTDLRADTAEVPPGRCTGCGACRRACPAGCIGDRGPDPARCLSAITQKKGELTPEEAQLVQKGGLLWGCDVCQEVCPYNRTPAVTPLAAFQEDVRPILRREEMTRDIRSRACGFRGPKPLIRNEALLNEKTGASRRADN